MVATFYWRGSSNVITRVWDHLTDYNSTPIGSTYNLVEYVTAGGLSMATYVASNAQNFPDGCTCGSSGQIFAVQADLSQSVTDGGVQTSAYTGLNPVFSQAPGAHRSASGSGSPQTVADPGAISAGAGALVYAVSATNNPVGFDAPPAFTSVATGSDSQLEANYGYLVPSASGSFDPQWNWYFSRSSTWLATVLTLQSTGP